MDTLEYRRLMAVEKKCERLEKTLGTFITWITTSAAGVLSNRDATALLEMLKEK